MDYFVQGVSVSREQFEIVNANLKELPATRVRMRTPKGHILEYEAVDGNGQRFRVSSSFDLDREITIKIAMRL